MEKSIDRHNPESRKRKLKDVCHTRWVERIDGLNVFQQLFVSIVNSFIDMVSPSRKSNYDTKSKASTFLTCITMFDFIYTLVVTCRIFDIHYLPHGHCNRVVMIF